MSALATFTAIGKAAAKSAASRLRRLGLLPESHDWAARAATCESCPLRVIHGCTSYCGKPFLHLPNRDEAVDGCGCPTHAKARAPDEHCPIDWSNHPARRLPDGCTCKWCNPW
jgi:hypothetical protein